MRLFYSDMFRACLLLGANCGEGLRTLSVCSCSTFLSSHFSVLSDLNSDVGGGGEFHNASIEFRASNRTSCTLSRC